MTQRLSYVSAPESPWLVIAAPRTLIALSPNAEQELIDTLWHSACAGDGFESLISILPAESGGRPLSFVLLGDIDERGSGASFMALVNGPVGFDVASGGEPHHIAPSGSAPWLRTRLQNVSHIAIGKRTDAGRPLPLEVGVVAASRIDIAFGEVAPTPPVTRHAPLSESVERTRPATVGALVEARKTARDGGTVPRTPQGQAGPVELPDLPDAPPTVRYGYRVNSGQAFALDLPHRFGRNPSPTSETGVRLVPLLSPTKTVSATHLDVRQIGDTVVVSDLGSTNGTSLMLPNMPWRRMNAGESAVVPAGTFVDVGDGNVVEIMPGVPLS
ncbi:hypothetical protein ACSAGD_03575 [Paramicrobacterium sp. CJ85]|uniref:hypothetical protein n=1 Tax=Paramicrobacterium sp. CJ85 TaxID=3445355 RepID=UPI003F62395A